MSLIWLVVIGAVAGWLSGQVMRGYGLGLVGDAIVGIIGSFVGAYLFRATGVELGGGQLGSLVVAFFGAMVLLLVVRLFTSRKPRRRLSS